MFSIATINNEKEWDVLVATAVKVRNLNQCVAEVQVMPKLIAPVVIIAAVVNVVPSDCVIEEKVEWTIPAPIDFVVLRIWSGSWKLGCGLSAESILVAIISDNAALGI